MVYGRPHAQPGTWNNIFDGPEVGIFMSCPICGRTGSLKNHSIAANGDVTESVRCTCGFHSKVRIVPEE